MDKLKMHTINKADENYQKLVEMFPNAITETIDENGNVVRAIDKDVLMQEINVKVVDGQDERYQFTWPDKKKSMLLANLPTNKTLRPCKEESVGKNGTKGEFDSENLYIEGDNLEVLKLLKDVYPNKIKMIYIDPPYNTGNDFVYNDNFSQSSDSYLSNSGQFDIDGNRLFKNLDSNGRFHTDWLNMIYPRIKLAKNLLSENGVILVSISDYELKTLQHIMDEIFGIKNRVCCFVWKSRSKPTNAGNSRFRPQKVSEYVLVYSKSNPDNQLYNVISAKERNYPYKDENGYFRVTTILTSNRGTFRRETMRFESHGYKPNEDYRWKAGKEKIDNLYKTNHIYITEDGTPMEKKYSHEETDPLYPIYTFLDTDLSGTSENGKSELGSLVGKQHGFDTVKPVSLIKYFIQTFTNKNDFILDFFSGSGTTAQAIMEQNSEDVGERKFILVQIQEEYSLSSEAYKAGFHTICDVAKKRIYNAKEKIKKTNPESIFDSGFRVLKCESSNMKNVYYNPKEYKQDLFDDLINNIKEDRTSEDLLFQVMLDLGILLSSKIEENTISGKKVFNVDDNYLIACFDDNITEDVIVEIAKQKPYYFVLRDASLANDSVATNFEQIFAMYSPDTVRKVL